MPEIYCLGAPTLSLSLSTRTRGLTWKCDEEGRYRDRLERKKDSARNKEKGKARVKDARRWDRTELRSLSILCLCAEDDGAR